VVVWVGCCGSLCTGWILFVHRAIDAGSFVYAPAYRTHRSLGDTPIGENTNFTGAQCYLRERGVEVISLDLEECKDLMKAYIARNSRVWNEDVGK
jgi:hypothetical protein